MEINRELLTGNINLTLDVYGTPEECDHPVRFKVTLTPQRIAQIRQIAAIVKEHKSIEGLNSLGLRGSGPFQRKTKGVSDFLSLVGLQPLLHVASKANVFFSITQSLWALISRTCRNFGLVRSAAPGSLPVTPDDLRNLPPACRGLRVFALPGVAQGSQQFLTLRLKEWVRLVRELQHSYVDRVGKFGEGE
jgi:hypothetical protein